MSAGCWRVAVLVALAVVVLAAGGARPAAAVDHPLQLSLDGQSWQSSIERPLFSGGRTWVPGDSAEVELWVRNDAAAPGRLSVDVVDENAGSRLGKDLRLTTRIDGRTVPADHRQLVDIASLRGAHPVRITLSIAFPASTGNAGMNRLTRFNLRLTLSQSAGVAPEHPSQPPRDHLPQTGAPPVLGLVFLGAGLVVAGRSLLRRAPLYPISPSLPTPTPRRRTPT